MSTKKQTLKKWTEDDNLSVLDMYIKCCEEGWCDYVVETQEILRDFVKSMIDGDSPVAPLLQSIEDNTMADVFAFDRSSYSDTPARPIYTKEELMNELL